MSVIYVKQSCNPGFLKPPIIDWIKMRTSLGIFVRWRAKFSVFILLINCGREIRVMVFVVDSVVAHAFKGEPA